MSYHHWATFLYFKKEYQLISHLFVLDFYSTNLRLLRATSKHYVRLHHEEIVYLLLLVNFFLNLNISKSSNFCFMYWNMEQLDSSTF